MGSQQVAGTWPSRARFSPTPLPQAIRAGVPGHFPSLGGGRRMAGQGRSQAPGWSPRPSGSAKRR